MLPVNDRGRPWQRSTMDDAVWSTLSYKLEVKIGGAPQPARRQAHRPAHTPSRSTATETVT